VPNADAKVIVSRIKETSIEIKTGEDHKGY